MIEVIQKPRKYSPSDNPIILQIESSFPENVFLYFIVEIFEATSNSLITATEIFPKPNYRIGSDINLSKIISHAVKWQVDNDIEKAFVPMTKTLLKYKIKITERGIVSGSIADLSSPYTLPDTFTIWNAEIDSYSFSRFVYSRYVISNSSPAKFLTYKPNDSYVDDFSSEQLYFMHDGISELTMQIKTYDMDNNLLNSYGAGLTGLPNNIMYAFKVSPKSLSRTLLVDFTDVVYYTVCLLDEDQNIRSEIRKYNYRKTPCNVDPQNLLWVNSLGGIDSYTFVNVEARNNITRNTIKKNPYKLTDGLYTDREENIVNASEEIIDVTQQGSYTTYTQHITDAESIWLNELFKSNQVFIEVADGSLIPIIVTNTSYQILKQRLNKSAINSTQITYTINGALIPQGTIALGGLFANNERKAYFRRSTCGLIDSGMIGEPILYTVEANTYTSDISQIDANAKADMDLYLNGKLYADANGTCNYSSVVYITFVFTVVENPGEDDKVYIQFTATANVEETVVMHFDISFDGTTVVQGFEGIIEQGEATSDSYLLGSVPEGTGNLAEMREFLLSPPVTQHQFYVWNNTTTNPSYSNAPRTVYFKKNNCVSGEGSAVPYSVVANDYTSFISQNDADAQASEGIIEFAQTHANANGTCI